jgi:hypothetical protein
MGYIYLFLGPLIIYLKKKSISLKNSNEQKKEGPIFFGRFNQFKQQQQQQQNS